jgi:hypothetical protein
MTANENQNFEFYKKAETTAFQIVDKMKSSSAKKVDIELALLTSIFELHRGVLPPATVANIIQTHLETIVPYFESAFNTENQS